MDDSLDFPLFSYIDPIHFEGMVKKKMWSKAMNEELYTIERSQTWELTNLPKGKQVIGMKWIYKIKCTTESKIERYKTWLVVNGYK